jgi:hypothetical protein
MSWVQLARCAQFFCSLTASGQRRLHIDQGGCNVTKLPSACRVVRSGFLDLYGHVRFTLDSQALRLAHSGDLALFAAVLSQVKACFSECAAQLVRGAVHVLVLGPIG